MTLPSLLSLSFLSFYLFHRNIDWMLMSIKWMNQVRLLVVLIWLLHVIDSEHVVCRCILFDEWKILFLIILNVWAVTTFFIFFFFSNRCISTGRVANSKVTRDRVICKVRLLVVLIWLSLVIFGTGLVWGCSWFEYEWVFLWLIWMYEQWQHPLSFLFSNRSS